MFAKWDSADEKIFAKAVLMTYGELWHDVPPLPEDEAQDLHAQLDRVESRWKNENT